MLLLNKNCIILIIILVSFLPLNANILSIMKLKNALTDNSVSMRGDISEISENQFIYQFYDYHEDDSHFSYFEEKGYQGGGDTWAALVEAAINLSDKSLLNELHLDPEADGLAIHSRERQTLEKVGRLVYLLKTDKAVLEDCIEEATKMRIME